MRRARLRMRGEARLVVVAMPVRRMRAAAANVVTHRPIGSHATSLNRPTIRT